MSDFPGYPTPFSTWNLSTSARPVFPIGNIPVPGLVAGISSFLEPGYFPGVGPVSVPDPLSTFYSSAYRSPSVSARFLPSLTDLPSIGVEPLYGCGLRDPRGIAHSPNFLFSQNPSPLTFDQIYRTSGSNSVSPVSQYRNQLDQRYINSRLLAPGRVSEPLIRKSSSVLSVKSKEEKPQASKVDKTKGSFLDPEKVSEKPAASSQEKIKKIWNPFEGDTKTSNDKVIQDKKDSSRDSSTKDSQVNDSVNEKSFALEQDNVNELSKKSIDESDNVKQVPRQPIPQYPVKPIPLYESQRLALTSSSSYVNPLDSIPSVTRHHYPTVSDAHKHSSQAHNQSINSVNTSGTSRVNVTKPPQVSQRLVVSTSEKDGDKNEKDLNQNLHIEENNNHCKSSFSVGLLDSKSNNLTVNDPSLGKPIDSNPAITDSIVKSVSEINNTDVIVLSDSEDVNQNKSENSNCTQTNGNRNVDDSEYRQFHVQNTGVGSYLDTEVVNHQNHFYQLQLQIEEDQSLYVPYGSADLVDKQFDNSEHTHLDNSGFKTSFVSELNQDCLSFNERPLRNECLTSPNGSVDSGSSKQHSPCKSSKSKGLLSPKKTRDSFKKKELKDELSVLSNQVNEIRNRRISVNKDLASPKLKSPPLRPVEVSSVTSESKEKSVVPRKVVNRCNYPRKMAAGPGALAVMKSSEDSLSASISSSQVSESDSDTQLSTDNAEKLFPESQSENTHTMYSDHNPVSEQSTYLSPHTGNGSCDNQFYKSNNPSLCQTDSDNQKPYLCVQEQNRFNEKSQILPPYNCYTQNQSTNVLPSEEESFQSQHEEEISNYHPQSTQEVLDQVDSTMDYDENSVMSESNPNVECDSQLAMPHGSDTSTGKSSLLDSISNSVSFLAPSDDEWEFLHSKQYIENIYCHAGGCEPVKNEDGIRESDSPKTFIDLDTTTKEKKAQEKMKSNVPFMKGTMGGKHYGKSNNHQGYNGGSRMGHNMYGNQYDNYGGMGSHRWNNYNRNGSDGSIAQSKLAGERDGNQYDQNQYRPGYQPNYYPMNQGQNGGDKMYNQSGYHGNEYGQNDSNNYYNQGQPVKGYQGNYGNDGRYDPNYYQNKPTNDYNTQGNMYPPTSTEMPGSRYNNQNYGGNQGGYNQHYSNQAPSHSGTNTMVQYQNTPNPNFSLPRNASPAGSEYSEPGPVKKKRGRKRKADKEPHDDSKPKPNTIVQASMNIGPLIDVDNPDCPIETYDYNHQIETIFNYTVDDDLSPIAVQFLEMEQRLCKKMMPIKYGHPVNVIYCPLTYAFQTHRDFVSKYLTSERPMLFLGMNPGPYGMSQNGCPFGEANVVRDWLKITGDIYKPEIEHPKKPVTGLACTRNECPFGEANVVRNWLKITGDIYKPEIEHPKKLVTGLACTRNEVSGARFWGLFQRICRVPENFFKHSYVHNFCPFAYMSESGKNITPPQLEHSELDQINEACDAGLVELVKMLNTRCIIAVGKFVQQRASKALHNAGIMNVKVECILHPSPINPHANKGWEQIVAKQLIEMNVMQYLNPDPEDVQRHIEEWEKVAQSNANAKLVVEPETL